MGIMKAQVKTPKKKAVKKKKAPSVMGRPTLYDERYCQLMIDYFNQPLTVKEEGKSVVSELPQITGFALSIGVSRQTLLDWTKAHPNFLDAYSTCLALQEQMLAGNAITNRYNPYFAQFMLKNCHGWKESQSLEHTNPDGNMGGKSIININLPRNSKEAPEDS